MTFSEFGRRVSENASGGTDHGAGSLMFMGREQGESRACSRKYPSLAPGDSFHGDLEYNVYFRPVCAGIGKHGRKTPSAHPRQHIPALPLRLARNVKIATKTTMLLGGAAGMAAAYARRSRRKSAASRKHRASHQNQLIPRGGFCLADELSLELSYFEKVVGQRPSRLACGLLGPTGLSSAPHSGQALDWAGTLATQLGQISGGIHSHLSHAGYSSSVFKFRPENVVVVRGFHVLHVMGRRAQGGETQHAEHFHGRFPFANKFSLDPFQAEWRAISMTSRTRALARPRPRKCGWTGRSRGPSDVPAAELWWSVASPRPGLAAGEQGQIAPTIDFLAPLE